MTEIKKDDQSGSETKTDGGETGKTTETNVDFKEKFEDQRKRAADAEKAEQVLRDQGWSRDKEGNWVKPEAKVEPKVEEKPNNQTPTDPIELAKLSNALSGMTDKQIEQLQLVAKAKGVSIVEAKNDELFQSWNTSYLDKKRKEDAKLGGGRGSDQGDPNQNTFTPGMSRDDHMKAANEAMGR